MKIYGMEDFLSRTLGGWPLRAKVSAYQGLVFDCACGKRHEFSGSSSDVLRELGGMQFVISCPTEPKSYINLVKVKGLFSVKMETQFGGKA